MALKAATSAPNTFWNVVNTFKSGPAAQVASGAGAELGVLAAQKAGAGPVATIAAAIAGAMAGGRVTPGSATAGARVTPGSAPALAASAENAAHATAGAEARAARAAEGAVAGGLRKASKPMGYSPEEFAAFVRNNKDTAVKQYIDDLGHHLDLDKARDYCGAYAESAGGALKNTQATHEPAGELIAAVYEHLLRQQPGINQQNVVTFGGGAGGSGKSTGLFENPAFADYLDASHISYDTTLAGSRGLDRVDQALNAGKNVDILFVVRDPLEAIISSFSRAKDKGRFIPLEVLVNMHLSARDNIQKAMVGYAKDDRVKIFFIDNTGAKPGGLAESSLLDKMNYNELQQRARAALETEYKNGNISEEIYRGILNGAD